MAKKKDIKIAEKGEDIKPSKLVKMQKGDIIADVHPDEVDNYIKGGYVKA